MANIALAERNSDFAKLDKLILSLEHDADNERLTLPLLKHYQEAFNRLEEKYSSDTSFGPNDRGLFKVLELRALIYLAQGDESTADRILREAKTMMHPDEEWVSASAQKWEEESSTPENNNSPQRFVGESSEFSGKIEGLLALYSLSFVLTPAFLIYDLFIDGPKLHKLLSELPSEFMNYYNFSVFFDVCALILLGVLAYFFFNKSRYTRILAITFSAFIIVGGFIAYSILSDIQTKYNISDDGSSHSFITAGSFIWLFYWIFSKRVKETFTK